MINIRTGLHGLYIKGLNIFIIQEWKVPTHTNYVTTLMVPTDPAQSKAAYVLFQECECQLGKQENENDTIIFIWFIIVYKY